MAYSKQEQLFFNFCCRGNITDLCFILMQFSPSYDVLHKGIEQAILGQKPNTLNFLIEEFEQYIDPHYNDNYYFLLCLSMLINSNINDDKKSKTLGNKLLKPKKFDKNKLKKFIYEYVDSKGEIANYFFAKLYRHPFGKILPKELTLVENYSKNESYYSKFIEYFKKENIIKVVVDF